MGKKVTSILSNKNNFSFYFKRKQAMNGHNGNHHARPIKFSQKHFISNIEGVSENDQLEINEHIRNN